MTSTGVLNPSVHKKEIFDLASCRFIREAKDVLFLGPPGVGKTHLTQAIGSEATHRPATRCDRGPCHVIHPRPPDYPTPRTRPLIRKLSLRIFVRPGQPADNKWQAGTVSESVSKTIRHRLEFKPI